MKRGRIIFERKRPWEQGWEIEDLVRSFDKAIQIFRDTLARLDEATAHLAKG